MTNQSFRFIHASDLHIERPINGLSESPSHLEDRILDAPRLAAQRMFQYARDEKVDFVVLSGDIIDPKVTGPWGLLFLIDEFQKLATEGIDVYWAGGRTDSPEEIPTAFQFPSNVHIFPVGRTQEYIVSRGGEPFARLVGISAGHQSLGFRPPDLSSEQEGLYTIGVYYGKVQPEAVRGDGVQYWALGGEHRRDFLLRSPVMIHYPGVNMARSPYDTGDYGVSLVEVNEFGRAKVDLVKTSPLRWLTERVVIQAEMSEEQILSEMRSRIKNLRDVQGDTILMISWRIEGSLEVIQELRYGNLAQSLLRDLRADFGREEPIVYSVDLKPVLPDILASEYYDQQTILGDYLRMLHYYQENPEEALDMKPFLPDDYREYVEMKAELDRRQLEFRKKKEEDETSVPSELLTPDIQLRSFPPDVSTLSEMLLIGSDKTEPDTTFERGEKVHQKEFELQKRKMVQRAEVLREAAIMGVELLSGEESNSRRKQGHATKNLSLIMEKKILQQSLDGKEERS